MVNSDFLSNLAWPLAALILGLTFLIMFRKQIARFLERTEKVGIGGIQATGKIQDAKVEELGLSRVNDVLKAYQNPLITEQEIVLRTELEKLGGSSSQDRETVILKALASAQISLIFEKTYLVIFGSQLAALHHLASSAVALMECSGLLPFYNHAKKNWPEIYKQLSFEDWLGFMELAVLITRVDDEVAVTVRGKEFLKYLIDQNYSLSKAC